MIYNKKIKFILKKLMLFGLVSCNNEKLEINETGNSSGIYLDSSSSEIQETSDETFKDKLDLPIDKLEDVGYCADVEISVEQIIPTIIILIDRSGSMNETLDTDTRWNELYNSLMDPDNGIIMSLQSSIRFGIALYDGEETCPNLITVIHDLNNYNNIEIIYSTYFPGQNTPTGESLQQVADSLVSLQSDEPKAIVLATDGEPDTCSDPEGDGRPLVIQATQDAFINGINTYVISVGTDIATIHLQEVANAGVGKPIDEIVDPAPYYQTTDQQGLIDAFNDIIGSFVTCEFIINGEVDPDEICNGTVLIDGQEINCGDDWIVEGNILKIFGSSCEKLKDGQEHQVQASFPCESIFIP